MTIKKIAFCTHVSDDWYIPCGCQKLERSAKYFHPEVPFFTFKSDVINEELKDPKVNWKNLHPIIAAKLANDYDLVVHFDADSIITSRLDEVIAGDYEVASVRNNSDFGGSRAGKGETYKNIDVFHYLNAGLVASTNKQFWIDWNNLIRSQDFPHVEQGALNVLFYSGKYKTKLLDPVGSKVYYGLSNAVGKGRPLHSLPPPGSILHFESWLEIQVKDDGLYLWDKKIKILHHAGVDVPERFQPDLFNKETIVYLEKITGTKFV